MAAKGRGLPQVPEALLVKLWRGRAARAGFLTGRDGRRLRVLYPGRLSRAAGPDFRDAVLEDEAGRLVRGDVEVHRQESDWRAHGHGQDGRYGNVVLHVVLVPEARPLDDGGPPSLALGPLAYRGPVSGALFSPWDRLGAHGYRRPRTQEELGRLLDRAGDARFLAKAGALRLRVEEAGPAQALYEGLMEALGYSQNRAPFLGLARLAPYGEVMRRALSAARAEREEAVLALLRGRAAGLSWHTFRVRPANHPARRMAAAAALLCRYASAGLVGGLEALVRGGDVRALEAGLVVVNEGVALVGRGRAADMAVNVVLPLFHALATSARDAALAEGVRLMYARWPRLQENELTREMASLLGPPGWESRPTGCRRQQGLIHLYRLMTGPGQAGAERV